MKKVTMPSRTMRGTAPDLRELMRDQNVSASALAWILGCSMFRALCLRFWATGWTVDEVLVLIDACAPVSARVPVWGEAVTR